MKRKVWDIYDYFNVGGLSRDGFRSIVEHAPPDDLEALLRAAGSQDALSRPFKKRKHGGREISQHFRTHPLPTIERDGASDAVGCFSSLGELSPRLALSIAQGRVDYLLRQRPRPQPTVKNPDTGSCGALSKADVAAGLHVSGVDSTRCGHELRGRQEKRSRPETNVKTLLGCFHRLSRPSNDLGDALKLVEDAAVCGALRCLEKALGRHDRQRTTSGGVGGGSGAAWQRRVALSPRADKDRHVHSVEHRSLGDDGSDRGTADVAAQSRERKPDVASDQVEAARGSPLNQEPAAGDGQASNVLEGSHRSEAVLVSCERGLRPRCVSEPVSFFCGRREDTNRALQSPDSTMLAESRVVGTSSSAQCASRMDGKASRIMPKGTNPTMEEPKARRKKRKKRKDKKGKTTPGDPALPGGLQSKAVRLSPSSSVRFVNQRMNHTPKAAARIGGPPPDWQRARPQHGNSIVNSRWSGPVATSAKKVRFAIDRTPCPVNNATKIAILTLASALQEPYHLMLDSDHNALPGSEPIASGQVSWLSGSSESLLISLYRKRPQSRSGRRETKGLSNAVRRSVSTTAYPQAFVQNWAKRREQWMDC